MKKILCLMLAFVFAFLPTFADSAEGSSPWARADIERGLSEGILHLDLNAAYRSKITRQDFCKLIIHVYIKENEYADIDDLLKNGLHYDLGALHTKFHDLNLQDGDVKYVLAATSLGIVKGMSETSFAPHSSINREQAAKMLMSAFDKMIKDKGIGYDLRFVYTLFSDDAQISDWARDEIYLLDKLNIMDGVGGNKFDPKGSYTREQGMLATVKFYDAYRYALISEDLLKKPKNANDLSVKKKGSVPEKAKDAISQVDISGEKATGSFEDKLAGYKAEVLRLVNEERAKVGLKALREGQTYRAYADTRAKETVQLFSHTRPNGSSCFSGMCSFLAAGENIAAGQTSPAIVMKSWMESPGHKANILNPNFEELSVGIYYDAGSEMGWYWSQIFYTPE